MTHWWGVVGLGILAFILCGGVAAGVEADALEVTATIAWDGGGDATSWSDPLNWTPDRTPTESDHVLISDVPATDSVRIIAQSVVVTTLQSFEQMHVEESSVELLGDGPNTVFGRDATLGNSQLIRANATTLDGANLAIYQNATLDHLTLTGSLCGALSCGEQTYCCYSVNVRGDLSVTGSMRYLDVTFTDPEAVLTGDLDALNVSLFINEGVLTIASSVTLSADYRVHDVGACSAVCGATIHNYGTLATRRYGSMRVGDDAQSFVNHGAIVAGGHGGVRLRGDWSNEGALALEDTADLNLGGTFATADIGEFTRSGGALRLSGDLDNTGAVLDLADDLGRLSMDNRRFFFGDPAFVSSDPRGSIIGGRIRSDDQSPLVIGNSTLDGVALEGVAVLGRPDLDHNTYGYLHVRNGLHLEGSIRVDPEWPHHGKVVAHGSQAITGTGDITGWFQLPSHAELTLGRGLVTTGGVATCRECLDTGLINRGTLKARGLSTHRFLNVGTMKAQTPMALVEGELDGHEGLRTWRNEGRLVSTSTSNPGLHFKGRYTSEAIGELAGEGFIEFQGVLINRLATLDLSGTPNASLSGTLLGGTVAGGPLRTTQDDPTYGNPPPPPVRLVGVRVASTIRATDGRVRVEESLDVDGTFAVGTDVRLRIGRITGDGRIRFLGADLQISALRFRGALDLEPELIMEGGLIQGGSLTTQGASLFDDFRDEDLTPGRLPQMTLEDGWHNHGPARVETYVSVEGRCANEDLVVIAEPAFLVCSSLDGTGTLRAEIRGSALPTDLRRGVWIRGEAVLSDAKFEIDTVADPPPAPGTLIPFMSFERRTGDFAKVTALGEGSPRYQRWLLPGRLHLTVVAGEPSPVRRSAAEPPNRPTITSLTPGYRSLTAQWDPPTDDGGLAVIGYVVWAEWYGDPHRARVLGPEARSVTFRKLQPGLGTSVFVEALTPAGMGRDSRGDTPRPWNPPWGP